MEWDEAVSAIKNHHLEKLRRTPEQTTKYTEHKNLLSAKGISVADHMRLDRLQWPDMTPTNEEFLADPADIKVLYNDHPYGFVDGIEHVCVWTRARCPCDAHHVPTEAAQQRIEDFLSQRFKTVPREDIIWFKNTAVLQSVPTMEHFHVLIRGHPDAVHQATDEKENGPLP